VVPVSYMKCVQALDQQNHLIESFSVLSTNLVVNRYVGLRVRVLAVRSIHDRQNSIQIFLKNCVGLISLEDGRLGHVR
jgi:hypothetical protein